jgi:hypothetical protein
MAYNTPCVFLETSLFTKRIRELISNNEYRILQMVLGLRPDDLTAEQARILSRLVKEEFR